MYKSLLAVALTMLIFELNFSWVQLKYLSVERAVEKFERERDLKPYTLRDFHSISLDNNKVDIALNNTTC